MPPAEEGPKNTKSAGTRPGALDILVSLLSITHKLSTQEKPEFDVCEP